MAQGIQVQCKERIYSGAWNARSQCSRWAVADGFCKQHHPDTVRAKRDAWKAKRDQEWKKRKHADLVRQAEQAVLREAKRCCFPVGKVSTSAWAKLIRVTGELIRLEEKDHAGDS